MSHARGSRALAGDLGQEKVIYWYNEHILANHNAQISTEIVQNFK